MFARLYTNNVDVKTAYSELSKVITGIITDPASLTAFNPSTSVIITGQPSNWEEYTTVGSTNNVNAGTAIWFRQRNKEGRWKYASIYRTTSPTNTHKGLIRHYTVDNPSVPSSVAGTATNNSEAYGVTTEYTIAAGPRYLIVATRLTTSAYFTEAHIWLEYAESGNSSYLALPNHILYRHYTTGSSYATDATTDIAYSTGIVEVAKQGNADVSVLNGGMSTPNTIHGTMKPSYFTSLGNTLSSSNSFYAYPFVNLFYVSQYQGSLDCSVITNVWGTGPALSAPNPAAVSGVSLLTCATNAFEDLSSNDFTITAVGNTVISDLSPSNPSGTWSNYFDGSADYLTAPASAAFNFGTGNMTIEAWIRWDGTYSSSGRIIYATGAAGGIDQFGIFSGFGLYWGNVYANVAENYPPVNQWCHVAATRSGNTIRIFINGTMTASGTQASAIGSSVATAYIGRRGDGFHDFFGYISNLRIVKGSAIYTSNFVPSTTPLSIISPPAGTSLLTCNSSTFTDFSSNSFTITAVGNTTAIATSPFMQTYGWSNYFDGNGDYISSPTSAAYNFGAGDFTIEAWVYIAGNSLVDGGGNRVAAIASAHNGVLLPSASSQGWDLLIGGNASTTGTSLVFENFAAGVYTSTSATFSISQSTWHHLVIARQSGTVRFFLDGVQQDVNKTFTSNVSGGAANCLVGAVNYSGYPRYINGYISNLRITKGTALYTSNFTPSTASFPPSVLKSLYGDSVTINGFEYAYLRANGSLSYLVPKR